MLQGHALMGMHVYFIESKEKIPPPPEGFKLCGQHAPFTSTKFKPQDAGSDRRLAGTRRSGQGPTVAALAVLLVLSLLANIAFWVKSKSFNDSVRALLACRNRGSAHQARSNREVEIGNGTESEVHQIGLRQLERT